LAADLTSEGGILADIFEGIGEREGEEVPFPDSIGPESYSSEQAQELSSINQARFAAEDAAEEERAAANQERLDKLISAGQTASAEREFVGGLDYQPAPEPLSDFSAGIAVGDLPADKIRKIRAQARMKGKAGSLGAPTPDDIDYSGESAELRPRELTTVSNLGPEQTPEALQRYLNRAPYDAAISDLTTREIYERDPSTVDRAQKLLGLGQERRRADRQQAIDTMINAVTGESGKIPADMVEKLQMLDPTIPIPADKVGISVAQAQQGLQQEIRYLAKTASGLAEKYGVGAQGDLEKVNQIAAAAQRAYLLLAKPGVDPNQVMADYQNELFMIQQKYISESKVMGQEAGQEYEKVD
jgi:hypothetical protein